MELLLVNSYLRSMCGITGYIDFNSETNPDVLINMTNTLIHRGPDGDGHYVFNHSSFQLGLGHRRLSVIDLSDNGKQPQHFEGLTITFNGEIYNYQEIKAELELLGHTFQSSSDTEMILHAYTEWKEKCLEKFIGMFAFVIFDEKNQNIFAARDRAGVKPFFYYHHQGLFLFASELKAFHQHPKFRKELDHDSVAAFIQYGSIPAPYCIFKNCHKLKPGHFLQINLKNQQFSISSYWSVYNAYNHPKTTLPFEEAKNETEKILQSAFNYRMVSDVPVGVFLSGGFDSTCVAALLQKDRTDKLKTFTIGVPDIGLNEASYAKETANILGTDHTEFTCTHKEAIDLIERLPYYYDEPFADSSAIPTMLVSKMAREQVTVALSADAGDEIFAGYNRYDFLIRYQKKLKSIPGFIRSLMVGSMNAIPSKSIPVYRNKYNFHNRYEKLKGVLKDPSSENIMLSLSQQFTDSQLRKILKDPFNTLDTAFSSKELQKEFYTSLAYFMAIDYQTYLVDDILQKVDRATMSVSLEGREPFLDHRVIEWAATLPDDFKYHNGIKKYILREIVYQYVPRESMNRPKMGFAIPIGTWLVNDLKEHVEEFLSKDKIEAQNIFNWEFVDQLKKDFFGGRKEYEAKLWYLLMFQMWYEKWMN